MKKRQKQNLIMAAIVVVIIASLAGYSYSLEQTRQVGFIFGNEIFAIQEKLKNYQAAFSSMTTQWEEGDLTESELNKFAKNHFDKMTQLISEYDKLIPPKSFESSVAIFKLSAQSQLESDREYILWLQTGDDAHLIRSDALIQESFEYDTAALGEFNRAKIGIEVP